MNRPTEQDQGIECSLCIPEECRRTNALDECNGFDAGENKLNTNEQRGKSCPPAGNKMCVTAGFAECPDRNSEP